MWEKLSYEPADINLEVLSQTYLPERLLRRKLHIKKEEAELVSNIKNYVNTFIQGPYGSGKMSLLKHAISDLPSDVKTMYVDCSLYQTTYAILKEIARVRETPSWSC